MKRFFNLLFICFGVVFFVYLIVPAPQFPMPPSDSLQSEETGDTEDSMRKAYFTDYNRDEIQEHYRNQFSDRFPNFLTYKLTYPPEEAFSIIRDQTRSTHLIELTHPFRESFYINEFVAKEKKDTILIRDKVWGQKVTVKYVKSDLASRLFIYLLTMTSFYIVNLQTANFVKRLIRLRR
jgi:hypothetical protein